MTSPLADRTRRALARLADPAKAGPMQRYMKSEMPFLGLPAPVLRSACHAILAEGPSPDRPEWREAVEDLWRGAAYREERYAALELLGARPFAAWRDFACLGLYEEIIVTGAWWDFVDAVATHRLRELLERYPRGTARRMRAWSRNNDRWKRRSAIICQVGRKHDTDLELLFDCIEPNLGDRDFFVRKGIGWALRSYAWTDLSAVERYVEQNAARMSPLSRREALKNRDKLTRRQTT